MLSPETARFRLDWFPGFAPALEACLMDWSDVAMVDADILQTITNSVAQSRSTIAYNQALSINCSLSPSTAIAVATAAASPRNRTTGMSPNIPILRNSSSPFYGPTPASSSAAATTGVSVDRHRRKRDDQAIANWCAAAASVDTISGGDFVECEELTLEELLDDDTDEVDGNIQPTNGSISPESGQESDEQIESPDAASAIVSSTNPTFFLTNNRTSVSTTRKGHQVGDQPRQAPSSSSNAAAAAPSSSSTRKYDPFAELSLIFDSIVPPPPNSFDRKFARCEALHIHGYKKQACQMAVELAEDLMLSPPNLLIIDAQSPMPIVTPTKLPLSSSPITTTGTTSITSRRKKKANSIEMPFVPDSKAIEISILSSLTLSRSIFLFEVLLRDTRYHRLAFALGLCMLELPRQPSATKSLEVTLNHQESEIVSLLKKVDIGIDELQMIRKCAHKFIDGEYSSYIVVPIALAHFIFDCLSNHQQSTISSLSPRRSSTPSRRRIVSTMSTTPTAIVDDELGFEAALEALGMKLMVCSIVNCES